MNRDTLVGVVLITVLFLLYNYLSAPSTEEVERWKQQRDSFIEAQAELAKKDSLLKVQQEANRAALKLIEADSSLTQEQRDSLTKTMGGDALKGVFGAFTPASLGEEKLYTLENERLKLSFSNKGARLVSAQVKGFEAYNHSSPDPYDKEPVILLGHAENQFEWLLPHTAASRGAVSTSDLFFEVQEEPNALVFRAYAEGDKSRFIEQRYVLPAESYLLDYDLRLENLRDLMPASAKDIPLNWKTLPAKIEKNAQYESTVSSVHYREMNNSPSYCNCATNDRIELNQPIHWVSHAQQFFNATLIARNNTAFRRGELTTLMTPDAAYLKELSSRIYLHYNNENQVTYNMSWYLGPNDYRELVKLEVDLERIIPFGWSIFGTISRHIIRPLFNFLAGFIGSYGLIIFILTLIVKLMTYPLQHKMMLSSVKMSLLKPELDKMREKYKDNPQAMQMEQFKMFNMYGVSPLGGCLPMLLTMPIWIALYRFFPASIEFRQKSFLWADDLASYDSVMDLGFSIPFYGDHVSLFTALWAISMIAFVHYNSKQMDMTAAAGGGVNMKVMKYMQYAFPIVFFFALNSWASGLTAYMLFSNVINIVQTYVTKNILIDRDKVWAQMQEVKKNPPKASFMEQALRQQEEMRKRQAGK